MYMKKKALRLFFAPLFVAAFILSSAAALSAQKPDEEDEQLLNTTLQGVADAVTINGQPALRLLSVKSGTTDVKMGMRDGQEAFVFTVSRFGGGRGIVKHKHGLVYITRTNVIFDPFENKEHYFNLAKTDLKLVEMGRLESIGTFAVLKFKDEKTGLLLDWTVHTVTRKEKIPATAFLIRTILNFDQALAEFNQLTESVRPKPEAEDEPEDEPSADISDKYDRFRDITIVSTSRMLIKGIKRSIRAQAQYSFPGETQNKPDKITLSLYISAANPVLSEDDLSLNFLVDGKRVPLGDMKLNEEKGKSVVKQTLTVTVPYDTFRHIADGKKVEFQVGALEYTLADAHREAFRNLLSYKTGGDPK